MFAIKLIVSSIIILFVFTSKSERLSRSRLQSHLQYIYDTFKSGIFSRWLNRPCSNELVWRTIEELKGYEIKTMVLECLHEMVAPEYLCNLFNHKVYWSNHSFRNTMTDFRLPTKTSANRQNWFSYGGAKLWNSIPAESKQAPSLSILLF